MSTCLGERRERSGWVYVAQDAPRACSLDVGPFPVHLTAYSPHSGKGQALETGGFESESQLCRFLAGGP